MVGLTRGTQAGHLARAAIESMAYQSHDVMRAIERDTGLPIRECRVDGGATVNDDLMQFQADILQVPVVRPQVSETTALGAAYLAGLATGFWPDAASLEAQWRIERVFEPRMSRDESQALLSDWNRAVDRARGWAPLETR